MIHSSVHSVENPVERLREPNYVTPDAFPLDLEIGITRHVLEEIAACNIHSHDDMLHAAVTLDCRVRALLAALDAERGERP
ncbi:hypothetical protein ABZV34_16565 [Streptomyces sp. NPDC005195]|uniref:hypothetical protein n=1 Tax=Streptomyces sp. NPDC005195 TaxID=3154561 RepID=UPI0033A0FD40